jgi:hypothetical protein
MFVCENLTRGQTLCEVKESIFDLSVCINKCSRTTANDLSVLRFASTKLGYIKIPGKIILVG